MAQLFPEHHLFTESLPRRKASQGWRTGHPEIDGTLVIPALSSPTLNLNNLTATRSPPNSPFRRSEYVRVAYGIPSLIFSSSPMRQDLGSCWNDPHNRLRIPKAVLFRWFGISSRRRSCKTLALRQMDAMKWISYLRFDEFDELRDFVLGKLRHIEAALPLDGENLHRQIGELVRSPIRF